jgi:hypothetical protein
MGYGCGCGDRFAIAPDYGTDGSYETDDARSLALQMSCGFSPRDNLYSARLPERARLEPGDPKFD